ncbi:lrp/AsnC ligand binding domain-containing protein [Ditylenchus destructor]|nr:lrp/AsnC ligand binding domain-containing protein [Ditylenchus destructor]
MDKADRARCDRPTHPTSPPGRRPDDLRRHRRAGEPVVVGGVAPGAPVGGDGVITAYVALVSPERVGLGLTAYINVRLEKHTESHKRTPMDLFRAAVQTWPEVVECSALTGEMDYLLRVLVEDMSHYARFISDTLLRHPSVQDCKTSFVLDRLKNTTALPV